MMNLMDPLQAVQKAILSEDKSGGKFAQIRPFPYPYKAALAICNDLDCLTTFEQMKAVHDVLNGHGTTPCGPGLGMEVGDSLHFFSVHPQHDDTLTYFEGLTSQPGPAASHLRDGIKAGLLDTLHTWGNYSQRGGFFREHAQWVVEELQKYGLEMSVWTNHGDRHNFQNLGRSDSLGDLRETASVRGDRSQVLEYHADLARQIGIRYVWIKELTDIAGQERFLNWQDWLEEGPDLARFFAKGIAIHDPVGGTGRPLQLTNHLLRLRPLRDGGSFYEMLRYGYFNKDGGDNLPELLSLRFLRRLVESGGACLLYNHLGKGRPSPDVPFTKESYNALARLAEWARSGDIWVTTPARLCRYVELRQRLKLNAYLSEGDMWLAGEFDFAGGFTEPEISGLSFYLPEVTAVQKTPDSSRLDLSVAGNVLVQNPPDHTGKVSYSVPLEPLVYPWE
jgi:hypothetical protein